MSFLVKKYNFAGKEVVIISVQDKNGVNWFLVKPLLICLGYDKLNLNNVVQTDNIISYSEIPFDPMVMPTNLELSKFVNENGINQLISNANIRHVSEFKKWINEQIIPTNTDDVSDKKCLELELQIQEQELELKKRDSEIELVMNILETKDLEVANMKEELEIMKVKLEKQTMIKGIFETELMERGVKIEITE